MSGASDLLAVQDLDLAIDQAGHRRSALAERVALADLEARAGRLRAELEATSAALAEVSGRLSQAETGLAATEARVASIDARMRTTSGSRELQAMSAEVASLRERASTLEDGVLELMEERQPLEGRVGALAAELSSLEAHMDAARSALSQAEEVVDSELAGLRARRQEAASTVAAPLLAAYERLRTRLGGVGAARLSGNRCDGCHLTLSSAELERVRHLAEGEVYTCEQCSRILVPSAT